MDLKCNCILVRYGELALKGKNRRNFIDLLASNLRKALQAYPALKYDVRFDRLFIHLHGEPADAVLDICTKVFGISSVSKAIETEPDPERITDAVLALTDLETFRTFKVETKRHDKLFGMSSDQVNRMVASRILHDSDWKVDVHHPEVRIRIEIRTDHAWVMADKIPGAGGYPVGIEGKAMVLLSGGIDSPVASWLVMKRGVRMEAIHFASPPYTSPQAQEKVEALASLLSVYQGEIRVHVIDFTTLQLAIYEHVPESYAITIMRRMMLRIAARLALQEGCLALASGESLGQVASQTLDSLYVINAVTSMPVLRPVVGMDKVEIIDLARKINTYETSILPFEDCCTIFTPKNPVTRPKLEKCEEYEKRWNWQEMIEDCLKLEKTLVISSAGGESAREDDLF